MQTLVERIQRMRRTEWIMADLEDRRSGMWAKEFGQPVEFVKGYLIANKESGTAVL